MGKLNALSALRATDELLPGRSGMVLRQIIQHADKTTLTCWPSVKTISKKARLARRTVFSALRELKELGLIESTRVRAKDELPSTRPSWYGGTVYRLRFSDAATLARILLERRQGGDQQSTKGVINRGLKDHPWGDPQITPPSLDLNDPNRTLKTTPPPPSGSGVAGARATVSDRVDPSGRPDASEGPEDRATPSAPRDVSKSGKAEAPPRGGAVASPRRDEERRGELGGERMQNTAMSEGGARRPLRGSGEVAAYFRERLGGDLGDRAAARHLLTLIDARRREGWSVEALKKVVEGALVSPHNRHDPARLTPAALFGSADKVAALAAVAQKRPSTAPKPSERPPPRGPGGDSGSNATQEPPLTREQMATLGPALLDALDRKGGTK